jgi:uncharacterized protein (TIGR03435 family)
MQLTSVIPAALLAHLWQSTLFALLAGAAVYLLKSNQAEARYRLWLIASLKFLVPFSFLTAIGSHVHFHSAAHVALSPGTFDKARQAAQVLLLTDGTATPSSPAPSPDAVPFVQITLLLVWISGAVMLLASWLQNWLRIRRSLRNSKLLPVAAPIPVLATSSSLEPGVFGVFRPVLLLPEGIAQHLTPQHLETLLAHELCHMRRRDNLTASLHMLVEAVFWFHPLTWYIGARLIEERERACDEAVTQAGKSRRIYAESILKTCQYYLESPVRCVAGVTGSDLKKRVTQIMTARAALPISRYKKLLLAGAALVAIACPMIVGGVTGGQAPAQQFQFEVASIKPSKPDGGKPVFFIRLNAGGRFNATGMTLKSMIEFAYDIKDAQLTGLPPWADSERFDIDAKPDESAAATFDKLPPDERRVAMSQMVQGLLADRFKFSFTKEQRDLPVYALVVAKNGPKLHESTTPLPQKLEPGAAGAPRVMMNGRGELTVVNSPLSPFLNILSRTVGRPIIDKTGLSGRYEFTLKWTPDPNQAPMMGAPRPAGEEAPPPDTSGPSLFTAIQEQLGLKLEPQKAPLDVFVVQHVERPSEN